MNQFIIKLDSSSDNNARLPNNYNYSVGYREVNKPNSPCSYELVYVDNKIKTLLNRFLAHEYSIGPLKKIKFDQSFIAHLFKSVKFSPVLTGIYVDNAERLIKDAGPSVAYLSKQDKKTNPLFNKIMEEAFNFKTDCLKPELLENNFLVIKKTGNGTQLSTIERKQYTLYNRLIALFGLGPLANLDMKISSIANYYLTNLENRPTDFVPEIVTYFAYQAAKKGSFDLLLHLKSKLFYNHNFQNISISDNDKIYALLLPDHRSVLKQEEVFGEHKQQLTCVLHLFSKDKREQVVKVFEAINSVNLALKLEDKETLLKMLRFSNNTTDISELINYIQTTKEINLESILKKTVIMNHFSHLDKIQKTPSNLQDKNQFQNSDNIIKSTDSNSTCIKAVNRLMRLNALQKQLINLYYEKIIINANNINQWFEFDCTCYRLTYILPNLHEVKVNKLLDILKKMPVDKRPIVDLASEPTSYYDAFLEAYESTQNSA